MQKSLMYRIFSHEAAGGVVLILATLAALIVANSPLHELVSASA